MKIISSQRIATVLTATMVPKIGHDMKFYDKTEELS